MSDYEYKNHRYASKITKEELKKKIDKAYKSTESYKDLTPSIHFDLKKVSFDDENIDTEKSDTPSFGAYKLLGYNESKKGLTYLGVLSGGDWEYPIFYIIYFDGKKLRAYIPNEGNLWNTDTKVAYGNDEEKDLKNINKRWPGLKAKNYESVELNYDTKKILADIEERIKVRE